MERATLLCHSSSSVQLWSHATPLMKAKHKEGSSSLYLKCYANFYCTGDLIRRSAFFTHPACFLEKCKKPSHSFAWRSVSAAAAGGKVTVEEPTITSDEVSTELPTSAEPSPSTEGSPVTTEPNMQRRRSLNRSNSNKDIVVNTAELVPGAVFPGKVSAIQNFGAFVDFGAFTNGLVHISRLSKSYVKKVEDVVQIGQDVKVQILDVDKQASRISLMLVEEETAEAKQEGEEGGGQRSQARTPRRAPSKRPSKSQVMTKLKKDEVVTGIVKNMIKSGVFLTLPDGTDGYLPVEEVMKPANITLESHFQVGQEVSVRVLRAEKGRVTLTTRKEINFDKINEELNRDVVGGATSPFEIAFRGNPLIASFLAEREKQKAAAPSKDEGMGEETSSLEVAVTDEPVEEVKAAGLEEVEEKAVVPPEAGNEDTRDLKEEVTAVEEAVEQGATAAEEVTGAAEEVLGTGHNTTEVSASAEGTLTSDVKEPPAIVEGKDAEPIVEEDTQTDTALDQPEEVLSQCNDAFGEGEAKAVDPAVEEPVTAQEEPDQADVKEATESAVEVVAEQKEQLKSTEAPGTQSPTLSPVVEEIQDSSKEITTDDVAVDPAVEEPLTAQQEPDQADVKEATESAVEVVAEQKEQLKSTEAPGTQSPTLSPVVEEIQDSSKEITTDDVAAQQPVEFVAANTQQS